MSNIRKAGYSFSLLACLTMLSGISSCDDEYQDIQNWVEKVSKLRATAKEQGDVVPYRQKQFKALKAYFAEINQMALVLKNDANFAQRFNNAVAKADLKETCAKVFLAWVDWQAIAERCTRNNFFLCAEEVRVFLDIVTAMRGKLSAEQQKRFDQTPSCQAAFEEGYSAT